MKKGYPQIHRIIADHRTFADELSRMTFIVDSFASLPALSKTLSCAEGSLICVSRDPSTFPIRFHPHTSVAKKTHRFSIILPEIILPILSLCVAAASCGKKYVLLMLRPDQGRFSQDRGVRGGNKESCVKCSASNLCEYCEL